MGAVAANLSARQNDLEAEVALDLLPHLLQKIPEELLNPAAAQANDVGVLLLEARFIVMLVAVVMHQVELVHEASSFEQLERAVDGDPIDSWILLASELIKALGIQVLPGLIDEVKQDLALAC